MWWGRRADQHDHQVHDDHHYHHHHRDTHDHRGDEHYHVDRDVEDVLGQHVVPAADQRERPGGRDDAERGAGRRAVGDPAGDVGHAVRAGLAGGDHQAHHVVDQRVVHEVVGRHVLQAQQVTGREDLLGLRRLDAHPVDDLALFLGRRVVDVQLEQEAVALGLGQRIHALLLDRVLRGHHQERLGQRKRLAADGDLALGHDL